MMTEALILFGAAAAVFFVAVLAIEGARRPGYSWRYHTGSELERGERGWVQRANFLVTGAGALAFALGVYRSWGSVADAALLATFAIGLIVAGAFAPDPMRGYPPGAPSELPDAPTWQHQVHHLGGGPVTMAAIFGACLTVARHLSGAWWLYSVGTAVAGLGFTVGTVVAFHKDAKNTGLVQRGLILVYWSWIVVMGVHLVTLAPAVKGS